MVGPPGSGKTTYCLGMCQYLKAIGREAAVVNLDPANHGEGLPYTAAVDIQELVSVEVRYEYTAHGLAFEARSKTMRSDH